MGLTATPNVKTLGPRLQAASRAIAAGSKDTVGAAALAAKKILEGRLRADTGGDGVLSGTGRKLGISYKLEGTASSPQAFLKATGAWPLIEEDTSGRVIRSKHVGGGRGGPARRKGFVGPAAPGQFVAKGGSGNRAVLNIPGIGFRRSARHPGTRGKHTFAKGRAAAIGPATAILRKRTIAIVTRGVLG